MKQIANIPSNLAKIYTKGIYTTPPHIQALEKEVLTILQSNNKHRLLITFPPRHGKSEYISKYLPAWYLLNFPSSQVVLISYASAFATTWSIKAKQVYTAFRNDLTIDRQDHWETSEGGVMHATGVGGDITGKGADLMIIDDPIKNADEALSPLYREKTYNWFNSTAFTRLEPDATIIVIQTRWHNDDLTGRLLKTGDWDIVNFPAINDKGEALWPERYPISTLLDIKKQIGTYWFAALYQQSPIITENQIIHYDWIKYSDDVPAGTTIQSWDTAFDSKAQNDYSVCTTWRKADKHYLIDVFREKINFPDLLRNAERLYNKYKPDVVLIEKKASGEPLIQSLKELHIPVKAVNPIGDKIARLHSVASLFENGDVVFPVGIKPEIVSELVNFPFDTNDDFVDSTTQALNYFKKLYDLKQLPKNKNYNLNYYKL